SVKFNFPQKIDKDDVYFTKILFESFINSRMVAINNKSQISFSFEKEKFDPSEHVLKKGETLGVVIPRETLGVVIPREVTLQIFGVELRFLEYSIYPRIIFENSIDNDQDEIKLIFKLPEESNHFILDSLDSIENFDMTTAGQKLFELTDAAIDIEKIDFQSLSEK
ncbi:hypothetical protein DW714_09385, partial [Streptococcus anginosus]